MRCPRCGNPVEQKPRGRQRLYCSQACRQHAYHHGRNGRAVAAAWQQRNRERLADKALARYHARIAPHTPSGASDGR